ncbi:MAG: SGNH/GDSL hydrolase family protein [Lachnospiraceae bacterium]|nr:SGNH/GDSL hydrolase family protein [Lachnospiraceae bacterium]
MKKLLMLLMCLALLGFAACKNNTVAENKTDAENEADTQSGAIAENTATGSGEALNSEEDQKDKEAEAAQATKAAEATKAAVASVEAKKAEEEKAKAAEATKAAEKEEFGGIADDVDLTKIGMFEEAKTMYVQRSVNVRSGPGTKYDKVDNLPVNAEVKVLGQFNKDGWYFVENKDKKAFISNKFLSEEKVDLEALRATQEAAAIEAIRQQQAAAEQAAQAAQNPVPAANSQPAVQPAAQPAQAPAGILFIGDSRCVQMREAVGGGNSTWICENGKGYKWLVDTAMAKADPIIGKGTKVVICLGVNDTDQANNYAALINAKAAEWAGRGAKTYFVSVNPVWENPYTTEEQVQLFNSTVIGSLAGVKWIDTHSYLVNSGYVLVDGLHYDTDTYIRIFNVIVASLR